MPELPEVEVVKKSLEKEILKLTIKDVKIKDGRLRYRLKKSNFDKLIGFKIMKISRRSKYLLFFLNNDSVMIVNLGMTGKFFLVNNMKKKVKTSFYYDIPKNEKGKHDRIIFKFNNKFKLIYNDVRRFGFIKIEKLNNISKNVHLKGLGPEPLDKNFNFEYFKKYLFGKNRSIKNLLMDQKFVAGLGNIYVNEILFLSKIKPLRKLENLNEINIKNLIKNTKKILKKAILMGGSSIKNFSNSTGERGNFQQKFKVYGKKGEKCSNTDCNVIVKKIIISNRSSFFCSKCQK